jgi:hypothetical protein
MADHMKCKCGREDGPTPAISSLGPYQIVCVVCGRAAPFGNSVDAAWATWNVDRAPSPAIEKAREIIVDLVRLADAAMRVAGGYDRKGELEEARAFLALLGEVE